MSNLRLAQIHKVHKDRLFGAFTEYLWGPHDRPTSISCKLWIILTEDVEDSAQKLQKSAFQTSPQAY